MSSASSGRYQSKLFNFVHQRSRRLSERCARAFRQLQVTTTWSVQALFYPVYLLLSTEPPALHSFKQHGSQLEADPQLPAPTGDTPIQRVLVAASLLLEGSAATSPDKAKPLNLLASNALIRLTSFVQLRFLKTNHKISLNSTHSSPLNASFREESAPEIASHFSTVTTKPKRHLIQGIATQLSTCTLVLITDRNEILDILTPQQQQRLQQRIVGEVAEYWRYWRLTAHQPTTERVNLLLPLQGLQQLTGWVQTVSIALFTLPRKIATSLSQESSLTRRQSEEMQASPEAELIVHPHGALTFLDRTVAKLESSVVSSQAAIALTQRGWLVQTLQQFSVPWLGKVQPSNPLDNPSTTERTLRIQALIWRAIDYFFGDRHEKLGQTASEQRGLPHRQASQLSATQPCPLVGADDPWLTMSDLFDQPAAASRLPIEQPQETIPQTSERQILPASDLIGSIWKAMRRLNQYFSDKARSPQPPLPRGAMSAQNGSVATQFHCPSSQIDHTPDWIETPATATGYVKHPLEKLLEWLDRAMLWLEKVSVEVWQWIVAVRLG